ncbi:shikimate dehydrogenase [Candidatus Bathyarchaeota archaeon]|nr:shikimate dehydrogenase [Candidatus Bathyarchaeota archaeon]MBT4320833.1 shikimate dehydrogenase [Candidatus Bathyarchaeota archaeon]MBT4423107.1 shikimate dehydrogenase [Candidatus Bathyarchaeota archaeon]MBT5642045.1 shikimate dehydrogenase [Candidatus Bathyarchaeota archaeon]MBT6605483.1 shikimate dehydrogenase [Candidatus Bathyarchaeota archaeon]
MKFYLLGYPVGHSVSPPMHNAAFNELGMSHEYSSLGVEPSKLAEIISTRIRADEFGGGSVTIPHKIEMLRLVDELDESAEMAGAVNTLQWKDGVLTGYNTDATGGVRALIESYGDISQTNTVLLGAGGAANALAAQLKPRVKELTILNRTEEKARALAERIGTNFGSIIRDQALIESADIIVNATSVGMHPNVGESPIDKKYLHDGQMVFDIVYNPQKTQIMLDAEEAEGRSLGGLWMLVYQGVEAFEIWTGVRPSAQTMYDAAKMALLERH